MMIYVVSLRRTRDRRKSIISELSTLGLSARIVDAVDARLTKTEVLRNKADEEALIRNTRRKVSNPELACAISHRHVYEQISMLGEYGAIVLEDDVKLPHRFLQAVTYFESVAHDIKTKRIVFHLHAFTPEAAHHFVLHRRNAFGAGPGLEFRRLNLFLSTHPWGTAGYYVTQAAAASLLEDSKILSVADDWARWARRSEGKIYFSVPAVVIHPTIDAQSEIEEFRFPELRIMGDTLASRITWALQWFARAAWRRIMSNMLRPLIRAASRQPNLAPDRYPNSENSLSVDDTRNTRSKS